MDGRAADSAWRPSLASTQAAMMHMATRLWTSTTTTGSTRATYPRFTARPSQPRAVGALRSFTPGVPSCAAGTCHRTCRSTLARDSAYAASTWTSHAVAINGTISAYLRCHLQPLLPAPRTSILRRRLTPFAAASQLNARDWSTESSQVGLIVSSNYGTNHCWSGPCYWIADAFRLSYRGGC